LKGCRFVLAKHTSGVLPTHLLVPTRTVILRSKATKDPRLLLDCF
jgi:hypothetical protein